MMKRPTRRATLSLGWADTRLSSLEGRVLLSGFGIEPFVAPAFRVAAIAEQAVALVSGPSPRPPVNFEVGPLAATPPITNPPGVANLATASASDATAGPGQLVTVADLQVATGFAGFTGRDPQQGPSTPGSPFSPVHTPDAGLLASVPTLDLVTLASNSPVSPDTNTSPPPSTGLVNLGGGGSSGMHPWQPGGTALSWTDSATAPSSNANSPAGSSDGSGSWFATDSQPPTHIVLRSLTIVEFDPYGFGGAGVASGADSSAGSAPPDPGGQVTTSPGASTSGSFVGPTDVQNRLSPADRSQDANPSSIGPAIAVTSSSTAMPGIAVTSGNSGTTASAPAATALAGLTTQSGMSSQAIIHLNIQGPGHATLVPNLSPLSLGDGGPTHNSLGVNSVARAMGVDETLSQVPSGEEVVANVAALPVSEAEAVSMGELPQPIASDLSLSTMPLDPAAWNAAVDQLFMGVEDLLGSLGDSAPDPAYLSWVVGAGLTVVASEIARKTRARPTFRMALVNGSMLDALRRRRR